MFIKTGKEREMNKDKILPISLEYGTKNQILEFDLNRMPHLSITGGNSETQASIVGKIMESWEQSSWIQPAVIDLTGKIAPEAMTETIAIEKLNKAEEELRRRYVVLSKKHLKNNFEYLKKEGQDMPFVPVIIFGFETFADPKNRQDAIQSIGKMAQKGRCAGINLILCSTDEKIIDGRLDANFPAKLVLRSNDEKDFSFSSFGSPKLNISAK